MSLLSRECSDSNHKDGVYRYTHDYESKAAATQRAFVYALFSLIFSASAVNSFTHLITESEAAEHHTKDCDGQSKEIGGQHVSVILLRDRRSKILICHHLLCVVGSEILWKEREDELSKQIDQVDVCVHARTNIIDVDMSCHSLNFLSNVDD